MKAAGGAPTAGRRRRVRPGLLPRSSPPRCCGRWTSGPGSATRSASAHEAPSAEALDLVEEHAAFTRTGAGGIAQVETNGLIAAAFEHWDSRAGDPNLHTHVAVSSKVQGTDGKWRALDARALYRDDRRGVRGLQHRVRGRTCRRARRHLHRPPRHRRAAASRCGRSTACPSGMIELLLPPPRRDRGPLRPAGARLPRPSTGTTRRHARAHQLARQANLDTRQGKQPPRSLADKRAAWREELDGRFGAGAAARLMAAVPARPRPGRRQAPSAADLAHLAERTVAAVAARRSTWTVWNVRAEAERLLRAEVPALAAGTAPRAGRRDHRPGGLPAVLDLGRGARAARRARRTAPRRRGVGVHRARRRPVHQPGRP